MASFAELELALGRKDVRVNHLGPALREVVGDIYSKVKFLNETAILDPEISKLNMIASAIELMMNLSPENSLLKPEFVPERIA